MRSVVHTKPNEKGKERKLNSNMSVLIGMLSAYLKMVGNVVMESGNAWSLFRIGQFNIWYSA